MSEQFKAGSADLKLLHISSEYLHSRRSDGEYILLRVVFNPQQSDETEGFEQIYVPQGEACGV